MTSATVTFRTDLGEQVRAARAVIIRQPSGWFLHALFLGMPLALVLFLVFLDPDVRPWNWWFAFGMFVFCGGFLYLFPWIPVRAVRKGQKNIDGPVTVTIDDEGVKVVAPQSTASFGWGAVAKHTETAEFLFIYTGQNVAMTLPKRAFASEELAAVRSLLATNAGA